MISFSSQCLIRGRRAPPGTLFSKVPSTLSSMGRYGVCSNRLFTLRWWYSTCGAPQGVVCTLHEGDDFGKLALVNDAPRAASIVLREDNCHFLRVDKEDFNRILRVRFCLTSITVIKAAAVPSVGSASTMQPWLLLPKEEQFFQSFH